MTESEELQQKLDQLPDVYPDFTRCMMMFLEEGHLVNDTLEMLKEIENATTETVINYYLLRRGIAVVSKEENADEA